MMASTVDVEEEEEEVEEVLLCSSRNSCMYVTEHALVKQR